MRSYILSYPKNKDNLNIPYIPAETPILLYNLNETNDSPFVYCIPFCLTSMGVVGTFRLLSTDNQYYSHIGRTSTSFLTAFTASFALFILNCNKLQKKFEEYILFLNCGKIHLVSVLTVL